MEGYLIFAICVLTLVLIVVTVLYFQAKKGEKVGFILADSARRRHLDEVKKLEAEIHNRAGDQLQLWKQNESENIRKNEKKIALREAKVQLQQWIYISEAAIRSDAIQRSQSVIIGKEKLPEKLINELRR